VGVAHTYSERELLDAGADAAVKTLTGIDDVFLSALHRKLYG
jgi:hypothetical protein